MIYSSAMKKIWQKNLKLMTMTKTMMVREISLINITLMSVPMNFIVYTVVKSLYLIKGFK